MCIFGGLSYNVLLIFLRTSEVWKCKRGEICLFVLGIERNGYSNRENRNKYQTNSTISAHSSGIKENLWKFISTIMLKRGVERGSRHASGVAWNNVSTIFKQSSICWHYVNNFKAKLYNKIFTHQLDKQMKDVKTDCPVQ